MSSYFVYMHINEINQKKYIGITCQKPEYRWGHDGSGYINCPAFWSAIKKYGWNNFRHVILYEDLPKRVAESLERDLICEYRTNEKSYGYNILNGGIGSDSETMRQKWQDPSYREDMSQRMRVAWQDAQKRKDRSLRAIERWKDPNFKSAITEKIKQTCGSSVICVETQRVYKNICDIENELGLNHSNICRAIKTGYRCGGYHWEYYNGDISKA